MWTLLLCSSPSGWTSRASLVVHSPYFCHQPQSLEGRVSTRRYAPWGPAVAAECVVA